jgi:DNA polymerase delta subunit 1
MALDIIEESNGARFRIWGTTPNGASVLCTVSDFEPYFYIAAPRRCDPSTSGGYLQESNEEETLIDWAKEPRHLHTLCSIFNRTVPVDSQIQRIEPVTRKPILYYRPDSPHGDVYLKIILAPGGSARRAGAQVLRAITNRPGLRTHGYVWKDQTMYEHEVNPLQRVLADLPCSGGSWLLIPPSSSGAGGGGNVGGRVTTPLKGSEGPSKSTAPPSASTTHATTTTTAGRGGGGGYTLLASHSQNRVSTADIEVVAPWKSIVCLTPDATQLADSAWSPFNNNNTTSTSTTAAAVSNSPSAAAVHAAQAARRGDIAPIRLMVMDVCSATRDGKERTPVAVQGDPIVAISCKIVLQEQSSTNHNEGRKEEKEEIEEGVVDLTGLDDDTGGGNEGEEEEDGGGSAKVVAPSAAAVLGGPRSAQHAAAAVKIEHGAPLAVVFLLSPSVSTAGSSSAAALRELYSGAEIVLCGTEAELLLTWQHYVMRVDPDVIALYQVGNTLETISQRFQALHLTSSYSSGSSGGGRAGGGGGLQLSRFLPQHAKSDIAIRRITMYSAAWVRSQSRMSSTSNQETFKADIDGRLVVDVLRQVLTSQNLASFSLVDCVQSILGETMEVLGAHTVASLAGIISPSTSSSTSAAAGQSNTVRLARYTLRRTNAVHALLNQLATIPEAIEMARATGLTIGQVMYNAQMVRTWSLLLRVGQRENIIIMSRPESSTPLSEHTFILHPVEQRTTGLYKQPVAILDFASLYPSIYRAYNLCYTTLVHEEDVKTLPPEYITTTPTGATFIKPEICPGILPSILAALISARAATRAELTTYGLTPAQRAVLDSRQKALKVTANALYGFTGATASPLQCVPLADSCLAYGAQSCRRAKEVLESAATSGQLRPAGRGAKVIYGHTDSLFLSLPSCSSTDLATAISVGRQASGVVSATFPDPMELKFERVCAPFMLFHVNRYAGSAFEREFDIDRGGNLIVKGLKSMWRQTAPFLRTLLHGSLVKILMHNDVGGAVSFAEAEIRRLLSGKVEVYELVMTGGLWRITGDQIDHAAAGTMDTTTANNGGGGGTSTRGFFDLGIPTSNTTANTTSGGSAAGEVRGPHANLAVRLTQRDPGRSFVLGERLQYVLTSGHKLQDDAAEDPLVAVHAGLRPDYDLYWKNKIQKPLTELFATCLNPSQLQSLVAGAHTLVKVDKTVTLPPSTSVTTAAPSAAGPSSPFPSGKAKRGGGGGSAGGASGSKSTPGAQRQMGMMQFFKTTAKCLSCRRALTSFKGAAEDAPGLCDSCAGEPGRWEEAFFVATHDASEAEARNCAANSACRQCHSGLVSQEVLCDNSECPVTYARLGTAAGVRAAEQSLRRLDIL